MQGILRRNTWVNQINHFDILRQFLLQHTAKHGLATAYFTNHLDDTLAVKDRIAQGVKDCTAVTTRIKQVCVRSNLEGWLVKAKIIVIHGYGIFIESRWILLDYGDVVIHLFDPDTRSYYGLEDLWSEAKRVPFEPREPGGENDSAELPRKG